MNYYTFSKDEIERLILIEQILKNASDEARAIYDNSETDKQQDSDNFIDSINRYDERLSIFQYQIYILVTADNWQERLQTWIECICPRTESVHNHFYHLLSLHNWVYTIIPRSYYRLSERIIFSILEKWGYEIGMIKLKQLAIHESDISIKGKLDKFVHNQSKFDNFKNESLSILSDKNIDFENFTILLESHNFTNEDIYGFYRSAMIFLGFNLETKLIHHYEDQLDNYMEYFEKKAVK